MESMADAEDEQEQQQRCAKKEKEQGQQELKKIVKKEEKDEEEDMGEAEDGLEEDEEEEEEDEDEEDEELTPGEDMELDRDADAITQGRDPSMAQTSPATPAPHSSASSISKGLQQVEIELRLLEALGTYHPAKLQGDRLTLKIKLNQPFSADEILHLLDSFYNLDLLKPDDEEAELLSQEEEFSLPPSILTVREGQENV